MFSPAVWMPSQRRKNGSRDWWLKSPVRAMCRVHVSAKWSGHLAALRGRTPWDFRRALVSFRTLVSHLSVRGLIVPRCSVLSVVNVRAMRVVERAGAPDEVEVWATAWAVG